MKRVFFYTGYHMEVFEFDQHTLVGKLDFYDDDEGITLLREYIQRSVVVPSFMLVDLQDEDFRTELVPHVRGRDRLQLINRLESKIFRDIEYRNTLALGRTKVGRRDVQYMFSSLLNVEALDKWMTLFTELEIPISGIWSVPYLSERILKKISAKEDNLLLFSRQMRSAIRETVFIEGKLTISRQAKLERRIRKEKSPETLATILASNVDIMHRFLINQRMLNYMDVLTVYALVSDELIEKTKEYCEDSNTLKFNFIGVKELFSLFDLKNCENREADTLFAFLCTQEKSQQQQYLPKKNRVPYNRFKLNVVVKNLTTVLSLFFIVIASFLLLNAKEYANSEEFLLLKKAALLEEHERLYGDKQEQIDSADLIKETVILAQSVERDNTDTPQALFPALSKVFDKAQFQRFSLQTLQWQKLNPDQLQAIKSEYSDLSKISTENDAFSEEEYTDENEFQSALTLKGRLDRTNMNYHRAVALMDEFTEAIRQLDRVRTVHILLNPIDVRISSKFSDRGGLEETVDARDMSNNQFELRVLFSPDNTLEGDNELAIFE